MSDPAFADNVSASRFELTADNTVAGYTQYRLEDGAIAFTHTIVEPAFEGRGIGSALASRALDEVRRRGLTVLPYCPFIRGYIARHSAYLNLVPVDRRAEFDLPAVADSVSDSTTPRRARAPG
jgi:predicted GNAT family acetyltransferase